MTVALIYPPSCDPTAPYISLPALSAYIKSCGIAVLTVDANVEAYEWLLQADRLMDLGKRVHQRLGRLERKKTRTHVEQLAYLRILEGTEHAGEIPQTIHSALIVLRDKSGRLFFDPEQYQAAVSTVEKALELVSAAYTPLSLDFKAYRSPFSLLSLEEIQQDARADRNPFNAYFQTLAERLNAAGIKVAGLSVVFPSQIQPAYALAMILRRQVPQVHITVGGPAMTQLLLRVEPELRPKLLGPFHSAVLFEGELALRGLIESIEKGQRPDPIITGTPIHDMADLPLPDYTGMPLKRYFSPRPVLSYDPTRGCYWGKCAFCHYGLCKTGTAPYRERPVAQMLEHLHSLKETFNCRTFYFSQDSMSPKTALNLARGIKAAGLDIRWGTDMRPEPLLGPEICRELAAGGAMSMALGVETGSERVLDLINKGVKLRDVKAAIRHLSAAGIAVEAMCFFGFPTETYPEALATLQFIEELKQDIALFICGQFELCHGSRIAANPRDYGLAEIWGVEPDVFKTALFFTARNPAKTQREEGELDQALAKLSRNWWFHTYPWAGSLSTAHTLLWYENSGKDVFRQIMKRRVVSKGMKRTRITTQHQDLAQAAWEKEYEIWNRMIFADRSVSRKLYQQLVRGIQWKV